MNEKKSSSTDQLLLEDLVVSGEHTVECIADLLECSTQFVLDYVEKDDLQVENKE